MARQRREEAGAIHHVFARGVNRQPIFLDDEDYERYLRLLQRVTARQAWLVLGFCLMPNHVHLLVETPEPNLGAGIQQLHSLYALTFNERHRRRGDGHVFQGPYGSKRVLDDPYFLRVAAYITMNPVAAGLCDRPEEWPWCGLSLAAREPRASWLAHDVLCERLKDMTGRADFLDTIVL